MYPAGSREGFDAFGGPGDRTPGKHRTLNLKPYIAERVEGFGLRVSGLREKAPGLKPSTENPRPCSQGKPHAGRLRDLSVSGCLDYRPPPVKQRE